MNRRNAKVEFIKILPAILDHIDQGMSLASIHELLAIQMSYQTFTRHYRRYNESDDYLPRSKRLPELGKADTRQALKHNTAKEPEPASAETPSPREKQKQYSFRIAPGYEPPQPPPKPSMVAELPPKPKLY